MCEDAGVQEFAIEDVIQLVRHQVQHDASTAFTLMQQGIFSPESTFSADSLMAVSYTHLTLPTSSYV